MVAEERRPEDVCSHVAPGRGVVREHQVGVHGLQRRPRGTAQQQHGEHEADDSLGGPRPIDPVLRTTRDPPEDAHRHSGYMVGGCSPFGLRKPMPVYMEKSILEIEKIFINGGKRGFLVGISPQEVMRVANATLVSAALEN